MIIYYHNTWLLLNNKMYLILITSTRYVILILNKLKTDISVNELQKPHFIHAKIKLS